MATSPKGFKLRSLPGWRVAFRRHAHFWGVADPNTRTITLHPDLLEHPASLDNVVTHEASHAVEFHLSETRAELIAALATEIQHRLRPPVEDD